MSVRSKDIADMVRIRQYLQEAQDWARESELQKPFPNSPESSDYADPGSVLPLIDASAEQADAVIRHLSRQLEDRIAE